MKLTNIKQTNRALEERKRLAAAPKVVVIGGGTGLSVLLRGLKEYTSNITAIVTVADDGGGSGILREDLGMLPPGDIRSCLLALANTEPAMEKLLQYRFKEGRLKGQNFGNLFIAAMNEIHGNFETAIKEMGSVLAVTGKVLPMTLEDVKLYAKLEDEHIIEGESNIPVKNGEYKSKIDYVYIRPEKAKPVDEAIDAIREADCIVLGPGSLYTSVIPNLLVENIVDEIDKSESIKIYISNVMTQPGETDDYSVLDHVKAINKHSKERIIDYVIANVERIPEDTLNIYIKDGARPVIITEEEENILADMNIKVIKNNLIDIKKNYIRHDAISLSEIIVDLVMKEKKN
ncbi:gluconeogenesis factor YvcK family protein [Proteiniborus sp. MB09-C3]|uniref:gluconeogenesis factor YvcK family protein n=1 Tax=Proteiniborus sp. MB09-C3 TaxID=3050072 RepID=UPI002554396C|nr:gluconeogenesis factor YvcK family protein [Proteiniborus sp. MB09-C3]WIV13523.1 YvcK family protein [Proteiniborus sp. MB09-C3]